MSTGYFDFAGLLPITNSKYASPTILKIPKGCGRWILATQIFCGGQTIFGVAMAISSGMYLFGYSLWTGLILGVLMAAVGFFGLYGSSRGNRHLLNLHLVGVIIGLILSMQFFITVGREAEVDCALAELLVKAQIMESHVESNTDHILINAVNDRLQEMETMMDHIQENMVHTVELHQEQQRLKDWDVAYINSKLNVLQVHAEQVVHDIVKNYNLTAEGKLSVAEYMKVELESRLAAAKEALSAIGNHRESVARNEPGMPFEVYEDILQKLTHAASALLLNEHGEVLAGQTDITQLQKAHQELEHTKAALDRFNMDMYHQMELGTAGERVAVNRQMHLEKRDVWNRRFHKNLEDYYRVQHHSMAQALDLAPQHCLVETRGRSMLSFTNGGLLLLQAGSVYCVMSIIFGAALKKDC